MSHITELQLQHFQPHTDKKFALSDITVLAGRSDKGKSACLRGLRWLCLNTGSPATFLQWGKSSVAVTVKVGGVSADTPEHTVTRINSGKKNGYVLDGKEFNAIGKDIPPEVRAVLNIIPDNFQTQHDYLYWFTESGSGLVKRIETAFGLAETAEWTASAKQDAVRLEKDVKDVDVKIAALNKEIEGLSVFRDLHAEYQRIEVKYAEIYETKQKLDRISGLLQKVRAFTPLPDDTPLIKAEAHVHNKERVARLTQLLQQYPKALPLCDGTCLDRATAHVLTKERLNRLRNLVKAYPSSLPVIDPTDTFGKTDAHFTARNRIIRLQQLLAAYRASYVPSVDVTMTFANIDALTHLKTRLTRLRQLCTLYNETTAQRQYAETEYLRMEQQLVALTGVPCPTCGKPL